MAETKVSCICADSHAFLLLKFADEKVQAMRSINKNCENHVSMEGSKKVLHLMLSKGLQGRV